MNKLPPDILRALQVRAARAAITSSSMRGAGSSGVVAAGQKYLAGLALDGFGTAHVTRFRQALDAATRDFMRALPKRARHWGLARKGLNIFLRECLYTVYLREEYQLHKSESFYEVPLDSITGAVLHRESKGGLPRWETVRGLRPALSDEFQRVASSLAKPRGIARVHLDAVWWGERSRVSDA
jgi:hypothetical protein